MKRLSIILLSFVFSLQLLGQSITPNMGKRLTAWCYSQDGRMATALNLLRYKYPNSDNLLRKIDNFENSPDDTKAVLLALYKDYGADWAYAGIHDYFTTEQIAIIEKIYTADGGHIKSERTDDERKQMSNLALKRGMFMRGFNGVSTKYLNNYLVWNNLVNYAKAPRTIRFADEISFEVYLITICSVSGRSS